MRGSFRIGTAGWTIPRGCADAFRSEGAHLQRYAQRFSCVEINSSFYRAHKPATYARWAASVPAHFRFAVKMPREITHERKLTDIDAPLDRFLGEVAALGGKMGPLLVQLAPRHAYEAGLAEAFFGALRARFDGAIVFEPRHPSWFAADVDVRLCALRIARVAADPEPVSGAGRPGGWPGLLYRRLHGKPEVYFSSYGEDALDEIAALLCATAEDGRESWCIFDNTARGFACGNALAVMRRLSTLPAEAVEETAPGG
jgi:uncharacterized protein YecE (DUF72 family)